MQAAALRLTQAEAALNISKGKDGSDPAVKVQGGGEPKKKGCCK